MSNRLALSDMSKVFLSHSHADKTFARRLAADLRSAGHTIWIDEAEINIGDSLVERIREGLDQVDFVAAVISSASASSPWVTRELDIAANREMRERRVVVLPLLIEKAPLPGFLEGKFYGDFTDLETYDQTLSVLLRSLGPATPLEKPSTDELQMLREELQRAQAAAAQHAQQLQAHRVVALRGKSPRLLTKIEQANQRYPGHAPINNTYAFEVGEVGVTLDYLLWAIAKSERSGGHPFDILLTIENKWPDVEAMLDAYNDLLDAVDER